jgi:hypothetical protein
MRAPPVRVAKVWERDEGDALAEDLAQRIEVIHAGRHAEDAADAIGVHRVAQDPGGARAVDVRVEVGDRARPRRERMRLAPVVEPKPVRVADAPTAGGCAQRCGGRGSLVHVCHGT